MNRVKLKFKFGPSFYSILKNEPDSNSLFLFENYLSYIIDSIIFSCCNIFLLLCVLYMHENLLCKTNAILTFVFHIQFFPQV